MSAQVWEDFPFLNATNSNVSPQFGTISNVPADGSAPVSVLFLVPYNTSVAVVLTPNGGSAEIDEGLSWNTFDRSLTGFSFIVTGGAPGSFVTVDWQSSGS